MVRLQKAAEKLAKASEDPSWDPNNDALGTHGCTWAANTNYKFVRGTSNFFAVSWGPKKKARGSAASEGSRGREPFRIRRGVWGVPTWKHPLENNQVPGQSAATDTLSPWRVVSYKLCGCLVVRLLTIRDERDKIRPERSRTRSVTRRSAGPRADPYGPTQAQTNNFPLGSQQAATWPWKWSTELSLGAPGSTHGRPGTGLGPRAIDN
jgi:hypothetical protein